MLVQMQYTMKHFPCRQEPNKRAVGCAAVNIAITHTWVNAASAIFEPLEPLNANDTLTLWQCERVQFSLI
jgi:hypothetical protein